MTDPYAAPAAPQPTSTYATWGDRVIATLWDIVYLWPVLVGLIVSGVVLGVGAALNTSTDAYGNVTSDGSSAGAALMVVGGLGLFAAYIWLFVRQIRNQIVRQGRTGQSWGKAKVGIWIVNEADGSVPGWPSCLGRMILHTIINYAFMIDYLWPLWDAKKQTLTDKILGQVEVKRTA